MRDFLASRVVGGRQQIRVAITFHEAGRLVMWPYGYTKKNVPPDMTSLDHLALRDIGRHMAKTNGYKPEQGSDLYITHGGSRDYLYGTYRIFAYTFEMSNRDYPKTPFIAPETGRNKEAVLWLAERAWCPLSILGASVRQVHCGALDDDFEVGRGWTVNPDGTDTAPASGRFARGDPSGSSSGGGVQLQPSTARPGRAAFVTGLAAGLIGRLQRPRRADHDPLHADHAAVGHGPAARVPLAASRTATNCVVGRPPARDRRGGRHPDGRLGTTGSSRRSSPAAGGRLGGAWTPGRATRSGSGSRPSTVARTRRSRPASTTCTSRARRTDPPLSPARRPPRRSTGRPRRARSRGSPTPPPPARRRRACRT